MNRDTDLGLPTPPRLLTASGNHLDNDFVFDMSVGEQLFEEADLGWNDYGEPEAVAILGREYAMGILDIHGHDAILTWKEPRASSETLVAAGEAFESWAQENGYKPSISVFEA